MKINKVTKLYQPSALTEDKIQEHINEQNSDGWNLVAVDNVIGWYRFFWEKEE